MKFFLTLFLGGSLQTFGAIDWSMSSRLDGIEASENSFARRLLVQSELSLKFHEINVYIDGFAETDGAEKNSRSWRRFEEGAYLREAYLEFALDGLFLKLGRQSARWSESWIVPSLDVWTARRYERLFLEPLPYQLAHSSGGILTIARDSWSADLALMWDVARNSFPRPYPRHTEPLESENLNGGGRLKFNLHGLQITLIGTHSLNKDTYGLAGSYAFEKVVPKFEIGTTINNQKDDSILNRNLNFGSFGLDLFFADWTLTPQVTAYENEDPYQSTIPQALFYLSIQYESRYHGLLFQGFQNSVYSDHFASIEYTYKFNDNWSLTSLIQNYYGHGSTLPSSVYAQTGGTLLGLRLQYNRSLTARN